MNNENAKIAIKDCLLDLKKIRLIIDRDPISSVSKYLTCYALIRICGCLEVSYKSIIADFYESEAKSIASYIDIHVREASKNATYNNICGIIGEFDDTLSSKLKNMVKSRFDNEQIRSSINSLNSARNNFAHGRDITMSFQDMCNNFKSSIRLIIMLDGLFIKNNNKPL